MDDFLGIIKIWSRTFVPKGWLLCDGTMFKISEYPQLFSLISNEYAGDGKTTFGLPSLTNCIPFHPFLDNKEPESLQIRLGQQLGEARHTLNLIEMPEHGRTFSASNANADSNVATGNNYIDVPGYIPTGGALTSTNGFNNSGFDVSLNSNIIGNTGTGSSHNNLQLYTTLSIIICWNGVYLPRS